MVVIHSLPARLIKRNRLRKLRILTREINYIIERLTKLKNFVFADPLLPFGTLEANAHCTHLQIAQANRRPKFAKECNLASARKQTTNN